MGLRDDILRGVERRLVKAVSGYVSDFPGAIQRPNTYSPDRNNPYANGITDAGNAGRFQSGSQLAQPIQPVPERPGGGVFGTGGGSVDMTRQIGREGLRQYSGYISDEWLNQLLYKQGYRVFREMTDNSPVIGGMLYGIQQMIIGAEWSIVAGGNGEEFEADKEFVEQCLEDMAPDQTWTDFLIDWMTTLSYGYSVFEPVYKRRFGPVENPRFRSKYTDGRIGWRQFAFRDQFSILHWIYDRDEIVGLVQNPPPDWGFYTIPASRFVLFRTQTTRNNAEGRSALRNAYVPWYYMKQAETTEMIGLTRDLVGIPIVYVQPELMKQTLDPAQTLVKATLEKQFRDLSLGQQSYILLPSLYDTESKQPLFKVELLRSPGAKVIDSNVVIQRYATQILQTMLADFVQLGHGPQGGSQALAVTRDGQWSASLQGWLKRIEGPFNDVMIPRLFALNGITRRSLPRLEFKKVQKRDLQGLALVVQTLAQSGYLVSTDVPLIQDLLAEAGLRSAIEYQTTGFASEDESDLSEDTAATDAQAVATIDDGGDGATTTADARGKVPVDDPMSPDQSGMG